MRSCNILPAAALFLFVGIVFADAEEPADEDMRRDTIYSSVNPAAVKGNSFFTQYFYNPERKKALSIKLPRYNGIAKTENIWTYYYSGEDIDKGANAAPDDALHPSGSRTNQPGEGGFLADSGAGGVNLKHADDERGIYDLTVPFDPSVAAGADFAGAGESDTVLDFHEFKAGTSNELQSSEKKGARLVLVFVEKAFYNSQNRARILSGITYVGDFEDEDEFAPSPLSAPLALFFVALGVGILLVMYTTVGNNKKKS